MTTDDARFSRRRRALRVQPVGSLDGVRPTEESIACSAAPHDRRRRAHYLRSLPTHRWSTAMTPLYRLRETRLKRAMSQDELADAAGVARTTIIRLERGEQVGARVSTLRKIADVLGVAPADLMRKPRA